MAPLHEPFSSIGGLSALYKDLKANNVFFDNLVDIIPAKLYVSGNTGDEAYNPKYRKGQHKESKEARRARNKASKIAKFDPNRAETTLQAKRRKEDEDARIDDDDDVEDEDNTTATTAAATDDDSPTKSDNHKEEEEEEKQRKAEEEEANATRMIHKIKQENEDLFADLDFTGMSRIEILRTKLRTKIAAKRALRPSADDSRTVSKRAARRAEKHKRMEEAKKRKASASSSGGKTAKGSVVPNLVMNGSSSSSDHRESTTTTIEDDLTGVNFGTIAGLHKKAYYEDNRSLANLGKKKSLDRLLQAAEVKRQRLQELKAGSEQDKAKAKKMQWGDTLKQATGERPKDDVAHLKKAIKRKANKKARSAVAWKSRTTQTEEGKKERQAIRNNNLQQRKMGGSTGANLSKKRIVEDNNNNSNKPMENGADGKKKRRMGPYAEKARAGFEGKKQGFITKGDAAVKSNN